MTLLTQLVAGNFAEGTVDVDGRLMRYLESGEGDVVVVLHGESGWLDNMSQVHVDLAQDHRVIVPELPGFGATSGDDIGSVRGMAAVVADFIAEIGIGRSSLIGSSIGATVALWAAIDNPRATAKLVLEAPAAFREGARPPSPPTDDPGLDPGETAFLRRVSGPGTDPALAAAMATCEVETLVLLGQDDPSSPPHLSLDYKLLPAANIAMVYRAGHDIKGDRPEAYLDTVRDFLRRGPAFVVMEASTLLHP